MEKALEDAQKVAFKSFEQFAGSEAEIISEFSGQCKSILGTRIKQLCQENLAACEEFAQQMLQQLFQELETFKQQNMLDVVGFANCFSQVEFALRELSNFYNQNCFEFP